MTDLLTGSLAAFAGANLVIGYPDEANTGGDLDLRFWNIAKGEDLRLRIQAKRLNAERSMKRIRKVEHRSYQELLHKPNKVSPYQFRTLLSAPLPFLTLYMFYNHQSVVNHSHFRSGKPTVSGINLAFAADIAAELERKLAEAPTKRLHHLRLNHLRKHMFSLNAILCPLGDWEGEEVPPPRLVAESLRQQYARYDDRTKADAVNSMIRILGTDGQFLLDRAEPVRIPDGPAIRWDPQLDRPEVVFISGRTDDERSPKITVDGL